MKSTVEAFGSPVPSAGPGTNPAWSPGSEHLVLEQGRSGEGDTNTGYPNLAIVDVRTGQSRPLATYAGSPTWSPDGRYIAFVDFAPGTFNAIARIRPDGTGRKAIYVPPSGWAAHAPDWSPNGATIAFTRGVKNVSSLMVVKPNGRDPRVVASRRADTGAFTALAWAPSGTRIAFSAYDGHYQTLFTVAAAGGRARLVGPRGFDPAWRPVR